MQGRLVWGNAFFSFSGLDIDCRGINLFNIGLFNIRYCCLQLCFLHSFLCGLLCIFLCSWSRRTGGYDCPPSPDANKKHPEKQTKGDQSYPGNSVKAQLKGKMFNGCFLRSSCIFFPWWHEKLRNVNRIHKMSCAWFILSYHPIIRVSFQTLRIIPPYVNRQQAANRLSAPATVLKAGWM